jgi:hypothetical protein
MAAKLARLTHKIVIHLHLVAESCTNLQFSLQAVSPETFGCTLIYDINGEQFDAVLNMSVYELIVYNLITLKLYYN